MKRHVASCPTELAVAVRAVSAAKVAREPAMTRQTPRRSASNP